MDDMANGSRIPSTITTFLDGSLSFLLVVVEKKEEHSGLLL